MTEEKIVGTRETSFLASVQRLHSPQPLPNKDKIVLAQVLGYNVIVSKDYFSEGKSSVLVVFFEEDALLDPDNEEFKDLDSSKGRLVSKRKMYGVISQGFVSPLTVVKSYGLNPEELKEGQDLTQIMKVVKYVKPSENNQYKKKPKPQQEPLKDFPSYLVPKTDEPNFQSKPEFLEAIKDRKIVVTIKVDGSSMTVTSDGQICGRNYIWEKEDKSNEPYFVAERKYQIISKIKDSGYHFQGELCGPKIQNNTAGIDGVKWCIFNVMENGKYLSHKDTQALCEEWGFDTVPELKLESRPETVEEWLKLAESQVYAASGKLVEGLVIKTDDDKGPRVSFKVISRIYSNK